MCGCFQVRGEVIVEDATEQMLLLLVKFLCWSFLPSQILIRPCGRDLLASATAALFVLYIHTRRFPSGQYATQDLGSMRSIAQFMRTQAENGADSFIHDLLTAAEAICDSSKAVIAESTVPMSSAVSTNDLLTPERSLTQQDANDGCLDPGIFQPSGDLDLLPQQLLDFPWSFWGSDSAYDNGSAFPGFGF